MPGQTAQRARVPLSVFWTPRWPYSSGDVESLGQLERRSAESAALTILIAQLAIDTAAEPEGLVSWQATIREAQRDLHGVLTESPSLTAHLAERIKALYREAADNLIRRCRAADQAATDLPAGCPYTLDQLRDRSYPHQR